jgi:phosphate transport system permease protein
MRGVFDRAGDRLFWLAAAGAALAVIGTFVAIASAIFLRAWPALDWSFVTRASGDAGASGGVLWQIAGTAILVATALATAIPLATGLALLSEVFGGPRTVRGLRLGLYLWNGVPSIVFGLFGLAVFSKAFGWGKSWLAGGLVLGLMILPTVTVALAERIAAIPLRYREAAAGLGLDRSQMVRAVILPLSMGGLLSGSLLGLARAAGETAPILFAAAVFSGATLPSGLVESPVLALPYHIFVLAQDTLEPSAAPRLWAAAAVLLALVVSVSAVALPARLAAHEEAHRA